MRILKTSLCIFLLGLVAGIVVSPWGLGQPSQALVSPVSPSFAFEVHQPETAVANEGLGKLLSPSTHAISADPPVLLAWFRQFEQQQREWQYTPQVLGVSSTTGAYTIALFGDSMVDTMGTGVPALATILSTYFPQASFELFNYGIGAQSVAGGAQRINSVYQYKDRQYPALTQLDADLIIVESFAYNPIAEAEYQHHLVSMLTTAQSTGKPVLFLASLAPLKSAFGKGEGGVNWEPDQAWEHATHIQTLLELGIRTAQSLNIPVVDVYHATLQDTGEGIPALVSAHDGIHPSSAGHRYVAKLIAQKIVSLSLW